MSQASRANKLSKRQLHRISVYASEEFSGPLPHPMILEKYERTLPGAANRIIKMAEKQADHRHAMENRVIRSNTRNEAFGIAVTFTLSMTALSGSIYLIASDKQVAGFLTMISTLLTLAYNFHSKSKAEKEAIQRLKESETSDK